MTSIRKEIKLISFDFHPYKLISLTVVICFSLKHRLMASGQNFKVSKWGSAISQILLRQAQSYGNSQGGGRLLGELPALREVLRGRDADGDESRKTQCYSTSHAFLW